MLSEQLHEELGTRHSQDNRPKKYSIPYCESQYINWEGLITATALSISSLARVSFFWFCCLPSHYDYCYIMLLFNFIKVIKLFLSQYSGFAFFSDSPPHPTKGGTSRYVALSCLSSVKESPSRKTFHVSQANGPPWTERRLVPEGSSCARDDLLWAKECAITHRFTKPNAHNPHDRYLYM